MKTSLVIIAAVSLTLAAVYWPNSNSTQSKIESKSDSFSLRPLYPFPCIEKSLQIYDLSYNSVGFVKNRPTLSSEVKLTGQLEIQCQKEGETLLYEAKLSHIDAGNSQILGEQLDAELLQKPFTFAWHPKSGLNNIHLAISNTTQDRQMVIVDFLQNVSYKWLQSPGQLKRWTMKVSNISGAKKYIVSWNCSDDINCTLEKTRKGPGLYSGRYTFEDNVLKKFQSKLQESLSVNGFGSIQNKGEVGLSWTGSKPRANWPKKGTYASYDDIEKSQLKKMYRNSLAGKSPADVRNLFENSSSADTYKNMKALFYIRPSSANEFSDILFDNYSDEDHFQLTTLALVKTELDENHQFIWNELINNSSISNDRKEIALGLLGLSSAPSAELTRAVKDRAEKETDPNLRHAAWLCATNLGRSLSQKESKTKNEIAQALRQKHLRDEHVEEKSLTLQAAGNLGDETLLDMIGKSIESSHSPNTLKQTALLSLRFLESPKAQELVQRYLNSDSDPILFGSALEAAGFINWNNHLLDHILQQVIHSKKDDVRLSLLYLLKRKWEEAPEEISEVFRQVAEADISQQNKEFAGETLRQM